MDRPISSNEAEIITWLLDHAAVCDVAAYRLEPVGKLRVVGGCDCGCASLDFEPNLQLGKLHMTGKLHMLADAVAVYPDGQKTGLILWGSEGRIVYMEFYDMHPGSSSRVPKISELYSLEEVGRKGLTL